MSIINTIIERLGAFASGMSLSDYRALNAWHAAEYPRPKREQNRR